MKRRDFLSSILGASAMIALAKAVGAKPVAVPAPTQGTKLTEIFPDGMAWRIDPNCPPDRIYVVDYKAFFGNPSNPRAAAVIKNLVHNR